jgi:adenine deaminase
MASSASAYASPQNDHSGATQVRRTLAAVALGHQPADLIVKGGRLVEVHTGTIIEADIAIKGTRIAAVGDVAGLAGDGSRVHDVSGAFLTPGFIDCHIHAGESQLGMTELARVLLSRGTVAISTCFYEAGTIAGYAGIEHFLNEAKETPLKVFLSPFISCYRGLGPWGNPQRFTGDDLVRLLERPECIEIREWNVNAERGADDYVDRFIDRAREDRKLIGGHLEGLEGAALQASVALGVSSDHETLTAAEAIGKARLGVRIQIRQGSYGWDLDAVIPAVTQLGADPRLFMFCTDGVEARELAARGHIDYVVRRAIAAGVLPVTAVQMATLNAAEYFRVTDDFGSLAPGRYAHVNVIRDLQAFEVTDVIADGQVVVRDGEWVANLRRPSYPTSFRETMRVGRALDANDFSIRAPRMVAPFRTRVIQVHEGTVRTDEVIDELSSDDGHIHAAGERDLAKICVIDRHNASGRIGRGFVRGLGIRRGAIATSMSPALMNLMVVGVDDGDMALCANRVQAMAGGIVAAVDGVIAAEVPLPILGIASDRTASEVFEEVRRFEEVRERELGSRFSGFLTTAGFTMMTVTLPGLRISDQGLVMVRRDGPEPVELFIHDDRGRFEVVNEVGSG